MTKPVQTALGSSLQAWDAPVTDNFSALFGGALPDQNPMPVPEIADGTALPSAAAWERCLLWQNNGGTWRLLASNGTAWFQVEMTPI